MPNHIRNRITVIGDHKAFFNAVRSEDRSFDFNKLIPPPDNMFTGSLSLEEERVLNAKGIPHWYGWQTENWGTKWNAYHIEMKDENVIEFDTAWTHPEPIVHAIAARFTDHEFKWIYADEDTGSNTGEYSIRNGKVFYRKIKDQSIEAYEMAFELRPDYREDYKLIDGKYECVEQ